jgi:hypothetical protein
MNLEEEIETTKHIHKALLRCELLGPLSKCHWLNSGNDSWIYYSDDGYLLKAEDRRMILHARYALHYKTGDIPAPLMYVLNKISETDIKLCDLDTTIKEWGYFKKHPEFDVVELCNAVISRDYTPDHLEHDLEEIAGMSEEEKAKIKGYPGGFCT